jgi:hypothetical protein
MADAPLSPSAERRRIENKKLAEEWSGCCSRTNRHFIKYLTQCIFGGCVIVFSMVQLIREVDNPEIYFSMLSGTLGLFLPHPQIKND